MSSNTSQPNLGKASSAPAENENSTLKPQIEKQGSGPAMGVGDKTKKQVTFMDDMETSGNGPDGEQVGESKRVTTPTKKQNFDSFVAKEETKDSGATKVEERKQISNSQLNAARQDLFEQVKFVAQRVMQFQEEYENEQFPAKLYLLNKKNWWDIWKARVQWVKYLDWVKTQVGQKDEQKRKTITAKELYNLGHIGSLQRKNKLGPINNGEVLQKMDDFLRDDLLHPDTGEISPANFPLKSTYFTSSSNDVVAVSWDVLEYLANKYGGIDYIIPRYEDKSAKTVIHEKYEWKKDRCDLYLMVKNKTKESKVRIFLKDGKLKGGKTQIQGPVTPAQPPPVNTNVPPPLPGDAKAPVINPPNIPAPPQSMVAAPTISANTSPPPVPPIPQTNFVDSIEIPTVKSGIPNAPPSNAAPPQAPPTAASTAVPPPVPSKPKEPDPIHDYSLIKQSIFVSKHDTIEFTKKRLVSAIGIYLKELLQKEKDEDDNLEDIDIERITFENMRIWRYEETYSYDIENKMIKSLEQLKLGEYSSEKDPDNPDMELNCGEVFPGMNMDLICDQKISSLGDKTTTGVATIGKLCKDNQLLFIEFRDPDTGGFHFKWSSKESDQMKCGRSLCGKSGFFTGVSCCCGKIKYCTEDCQDKDSTHLNTCEELRKKELDPALLNFTVNETPRNGICGLNNLGNTCYMNSSIQCLSHTKALRDYFCRFLYFKDQINTENPLASKDNEVVIRFAHLLNILHNKKKEGGYCDVNRPSRMKEAFGQVNSMFKGFAQQDAQELIQCLFDTLNEDLNRVSKKPYTELPPYKELKLLTESQLHELYQEMGLKRNQSFIQDLFTGTYKSIIQCLECNNISKVFTPYNTLHVSIPQTTASLSFYFIPYNMGERVFSYKMNHVSLLPDQDDDLDEESKALKGTFSLYSLKQKICEVVKHFYGAETHYGGIGLMGKKQFRLTSHSNEPWESTAPPDIGPHDLVLASVHKKKFIFEKIFCESAGHNLWDVVNRCGMADYGDYLFVYQLDPKSIDIQKIRQLRTDGQEHTIKFPNQLLQNYVQIPIQTAEFERKTYETKLSQIKPGQSVFEYDALSQNCWKPHPPRFVMINTEWDTITMYRYIMDIYTKMFRKPDPPKETETKGTSVTTPKKGEQGTSKGGTLLDPSEIPFPASDDEGDKKKAGTKVDGKAEGAKTEQIDSTTKKDGKVDYEIYMPKPTFTYEDLFQPLDDFIKEKGKAPSIHELDFLKGDNIQPISLNFISNKRVFHVPLTTEYSCGKMFATLAQPEKYKDCNMDQFEDINPEDKYKGKTKAPPDDPRSEVIKLQLVINSNHKLLPFSTISSIKNTTQDWTSLYKQFQYDKDSKIIVKEEKKTDQIDSSSKPADKSTVAVADQTIPTLDKCLIYMTKQDILEDHNAYNCEVCDKKVSKATKSTGVYTLPPILLLCLQRFRGGSKNTDVIDFPLKDFDMSKHLKNDYHKHEQDDCTYDLYAVVNHIGSTLTSGHYVADCFNEEEQSWYNFNDTTVTKIEAADDAALHKKICTGNCYVLFYKRRGFKCEKYEDYEALRVIPTGKYDSMIKIIETSAHRKKEPEAVEDDGAIKCKKGHKLEECKEMPKSYDQSEQPECDNCDKQFTWADGFMHCEDCMYDICMKCHKEKLDEKKKAEDDKALNADLPGLEKGNSTSNDFLKLQQVQTTISGEADIEAGSPGTPNLEIVGKAIQSGSYPPKD